MPPLPGQNVSVYVVNDWCAVNKTVEEPPPGSPEKVSQHTTLGGVYIDEDEYIDLPWCVITELDVETIWTLVKEEDYLKSINWFGISFWPEWDEVPHPCVLFELIVPPSLGGLGGTFHFQLQASAELELMDDEDVDLENNSADTPILDLYVTVPF